MIKDLGLTPYRKTRADQLSGGNKRKLSIAIALCAQSKFVLLDEPSSGLDISARRQLWNMLSQYKRNRIIIMTTHYMDEAEVLGDRIGIMNHGKMTVLGSQIFIRKTFGEGYEMAVEKENWASSYAIQQFIKHNLSQNVQILYDMDHEVAFKIPKDSAEDFSNFFAEFDQNMEKLGIKNYGMELTTLEKIFLAIGHLKEP